MFSQSELTRYSRQIQLDDFGQIGQKCLKNARIVVVGAGGLGCPVIQYLSSAGIGNTTIIDGDTVSESNLQRQVLFQQADIGFSKAQCACTKAKEINSFVNVTAVHSYLNAELAFDVFKEADLIVDCTDNFGTRYLINDVCVLLNKPFVSSALFKYEGQLSIYHVKTKTGYSANFRDVFPENNNTENALDCNSAGVIATLPGIMGLYQANEVIKYFVDKSFCLINKLLTVNCKRMTHHVFEINTEAKTKALTKEEIKNRTYSLPCFVEENKEKLSISHVVNLLNNESTILVDVRELNESPRLENIHHLVIPLSEIETAHEKLSSYKKIIFICKSGKRSIIAKASVESLYKNIEFECCNFGVDELMRNIKIDMV